MHSQEPGSGNQRRLQSLDGDAVARREASRQARALRVRTIRRRIFTSALALFVASWLLIAVVLVSGHDPALAAHKSGTASGSSSSSAGTSTGGSQGTSSVDSMGGRQGTSSGTSSGGSSSESQSSSTNGGTSSSVTTRQS